MSSLSWNFRTTPGPSSPGSAVDSGRAREQRRPRVDQVLHHHGCECLLHRYELRVRVAHEAEEEQPRVEVAAVVDTVDDVVAAAQDPHTAEVSAEANPMCESTPMTGSPSGRAASNAARANSSVPPSGAPEPLCRPTISSCSPSRRPHRGELTDREQAVLRALTTDATQREIGAALYLSINTVKGYTKVLYRKLGVATRQDAVRRARALGLI